MADKLTLTVGKTPDGRNLGVITTGGHPQRPGSGKTTVLSVEVLPDGDDGLAWFAQQKRDRPWETRQ